METKEMRYPVLLEKDKNSDFGVTVPNLPGCFSAGESVDEAMMNVKEAILTHVEGLLIDNEVIPSPSPIDMIQRQFPGKELIWAFCEVNLADLSDKNHRVNITIPERLLTKIDSFAQSEGESRSGFLTHAALEYISYHSLKRTESVVIPKK